MSQNHLGLLCKGTLVGPTAASAGPKTSEKDNPAGPGFSPFSLLPNQPQAVPQGQATVSEWTPAHGSPPSSGSTGKGQVPLGRRPQPQPL